MHRRLVGPLCLLLVGAFAGIAEAQVTTGSIRGTVTATTGEPIAAVGVTATNVARGVTFSTVASEDGRYALPALPVGRYDVEVSRIGFQALRRENVRVRLGETALIDFSMEVSAAQLEAITVVGEQPLIDPDETGVVDLVSAEEIEAIPVNGRNFADLVALSPKVGVDIGDGTGGALSLGGGRRGANLIQIDGAGTTGTFFGGEARGSDRIPFAFSIESVSEFQVVSNGFDVEYGFFSGGVINAVTKSGTNTFRGSLFGFFRDDAITRNDFFDREADFTSRQIGGTLSGPLVRDKLHFFLAVERQDRDEPVFGLPAPGEEPDPSRRVHPDSVRRFLEILQEVYGVTDQAGSFKETQDEWAVFGRLDWQISNKHRLTLRHNFTDLEQKGDRIRSDETIGNGGVFENTGNSTVLQLNSVFSPNVWNEARAQIAFEPRPREANSLLPEAEVNVNSDFDPTVDSDGDGDPTNDRDESLRGMECCNDAVLPNNLEETTFEFTNNLYIRAGDHEVKLGGIFNLFDFENFFFFNQQGQFDFNSLSDFENMIVDDFGRALPNPGPDGQFFTDDDIQPLALYQTYEVGLYAQDTWHVSDRFSLTAGIRFDFTRLPDEAPLNDDLVSELGIRTDVTPDDNNISPRVSFTYDPSGSGSSVIRGGVGLFFGRFPSVLYSNSLLNTGGNQLFLFCDEDEAPVPDYRAFAADLRNIPTSCAGGGAASPPTADINVFAPNFEYPRTWKASFGFEQELVQGLKVDFDFLFSSTDKNFAVQDRNQLPEQFRSGIENRPQFTPLSGIRSSGSPSSRAGRITNDFDEVLVHVSTAEARTYQFTVGLSQRGERFSWQAGYTYTNSKDNASYSCCITGTALFETPTAGNINFLGDRGDDVNGSWGDSDFNREHSLVFSGIFELPFDFAISGIWRTFSGRPWTPVVDGNVNGDRDFSNDRAFIGTNLVFDDPATDIPLLEQHLANFECLREAVGTIIRRNTCRNDFFTQFDLRLRKRFRTVGNQRFEITADFFNVLNLINSDWGRNVGVGQFSDERELLSVEGFDAATQTYIYSVNPSFGEEVDLRAQRTDQGSVQIGVKYVF
ncbi:MAG: TonB-dependent receptor domain-containing protein [Gemmatimonadota bacterium]